jgi:uncharacterized membrane protein YphA (DoxX/SURF4 family)
LVLLRTAIGWHFLYEGVEKVYSTPEGRDSLLARVLPRPPKPEKPEPPFSAEDYLRNASGPLAPWFRGLVPDVDSLDKLDSTKLQASWERDLARYADHYRFNEKQRAEAAKSLQNQKSIAEAWFLDPENIDKVKKYRDELAYVDRVLSDRKSLKYQRERAYEERRELDASRRELVAVTSEWTSALHDAWRKLAPKSEYERAGEPEPLWSRLDWINLITMVGLLAVGICLMLGLFTPLAALGAAAYLALFYLSMPPWPGVPQGPKVEGHYLFVNKNLIELLACLVLAKTPNGLWIGLDAILFGRRARRRAWAAEQAEASPSDGFAERPRADRAEPVRKIPRH